MAAAVPVILTVPFVASKTGTVNRTVLFRSVTGLFNRPVAVYFSWRDRIQRERAVARHLKDAMEYMALTRWELEYRTMPWWALCPLGQKIHL